MAADMGVDRTLKISLACTDRRSGHVAGQDAPFCAAGSAEGRALNQALQQRLASQANEPLSFELFEEALSHRHHQPAAAQGVARFI
jgi:hypothetical protein